SSTEKAPGRFGIMTTRLPSRHRGGGHVLSHSGVRMRFTTSTPQPTCACWYSDAVHQDTKATEGCRLVLTYNM
ncbi:hypothetical protein DOTSEDRAFT_115859, partial [Dothistroma septosporum NZE10]